MSETTFEQDHHAWLERVSDAARQVIDETRATTAKRIVRRLKKIAATGIFGDDFRHRSLWDEYCHNLEDGDSGTFSLGPEYHRIFDSYVCEQLDGLKQSECRLISEFWRYDQKDDWAEIPANPRQDCYEAVWAKLEELAMEQNRPDDGSS